MKTPKMSSLDFFSIIGGFLGLGIGLSVVSLIQIFDMIFEIIMIFIERQKLKRMRNKSKTSNKYDKNEELEKLVKFILINRYHFETG